MEPVGIFAVVAVSFVIVLSSVTGHGKQLCDALGGTYTPQSQQDVCPGGSWANLVTNAKK